MKVLIVDDSLVYRNAIRDILTEEYGIEVVGMARDGVEAIEKAKSLNPDLITLDIEMPLKDGIQALKEIRTFNSKVRIIIFSSLSQQGAEKTLEALTSGADDFCAKPQYQESLRESMGVIRSELVPKIKQFEKHQESSWGEERLVSKGLVSKPALKNLHQGQNKIDAIVIGSSTGGPDALKKIFKKLKDTNGVPIFIVQHMPSHFTSQLAQLLSGETTLRVKEAKHHETVMPGVCYIAPGGQHMLVRRKGSTTDVWIELNENEKENFVRPSADVLFRSAAQLYGQNLLSIVITGMGQDGLQGAKLIKEKGGYVVIQDEASSTVWGMAGVIYRSGLADKVLDIHEIAPFIENCCQGKLEVFDSE